MRRLLIRLNVPSLELLYTIGLHQSGHANVSGIWSGDGYGIEMCHLVMKERRFWQLLTALRFDNVHQEDRQHRLATEKLAKIREFWEPFIINSKRAYRHSWRRLVMKERRFGQLLTALRFDNVNQEDRQHRLATEKLAKIREFWEPFIINSQRAYRPSCHLTVDEMVVTFRGKCQFRQYIRSKAAKYGLKVHALCDAETFYTLNMELYAGKKQGISNQPVDIVLRLTDCVTGSRHTIVKDNWYTSYELAIALLN